MHTKRVPPREIQTVAKHHNEFAPEAKAQKQQQNKRKME